MADLEYEEITDHITVSVVFTNHEDKGYTRAESLRITGMFDNGDDLISIRGIEHKSGSVIRLDLAYGEGK
jgi:hypothetical protein